MGNQAMKTRLEEEINTIKVPAVVLYPAYNTLQRMKTNLNASAETSLSGKNTVEKAGYTVELAGRTDNMVSGLIEGENTGKRPNILARQKLAGVFSYYLDGITNGKK